MTTATGSIELLQQDRLKYWCERIKIPAGAVEELEIVHTAVREEPVLQQIFTDFYEQTAVRGEWFRDWTMLPMHPDVVERFGEDRASMFYVLAYMAALPSVETEYHRRGISTEIFDATMLDIGIWLDRIHAVRGRWYFNQFMWIWRHMELRIFRLGRLQFCLEPYDWHATAYRHRVSGRYLVLSGPEIPLRADGHALGAGLRRGAEPPPESEAWYAVFEETDDGWRGNPVHPMGYARREPVFLLKTEWECVLRRGDWQLELHIPRGESMSVEACRDSFRQAEAFFAHHCPDRSYRIAHCHTWFFTPQIQSFVSPESNIIRFQREFYLYPTKGGPEFLWSYVIGDNYSMDDLASAPRETALQRATLGWLENGGELFDMAGMAFHGSEAWGTQPYMSNPPSEFAEDQEKE